MSFESTLQSIVDESGGGLSAALMGLDGIAIAQVRASGERDPSDPPGGRRDPGGIEFGRVLGDMTKASDSLGTGDLREAVVQLDRVTLVFHAVDEDLVLVLGPCGPDGNMGQGRATSFGATCSRSARNSSDRETGRDAERDGARRRKRGGSCRVHLQWRFWSCTARI